MVFCCSMQIIFIELLSTILYQVHWYFLGVCLKWYDLFLHSFHWLLFSFLILEWLIRNLFIQHSAYFNVISWVASYLGWNLVLLSHSSFDSNNCLTWIFWFDFTLIMLRAVDLLNLYSFLMDYYYIRFTNLLVC